MACRVGITTNIEERKSYWKSQHPGMRNWRIVSSGLTYTQAQDKEKSYAAQYGCKAHAGGERKAGYGYSVYRFDY